MVVYRGSGVVNFAHAGLGMLGAFWFYLWRDGGMSTGVALLLALVLGAAMGAATHLLIMRPLRDAPALARLIATLGLLAFSIAFGLERWGDSPRIVAKVLPVDAVDLGGDLVVGSDRLVLAGIATAGSVALMALYRWTRFGLATSAVAEDRRATAVLGVSPDAVATGNWALGTALAVAGMILTVNVTGLQPVNLALLVVPGLAAALVGGFHSFPLTLAGGLLIGMLESEIAYVQTKVSDPALLAGWGRAVPFAVIIVVLTVRGRSLPLRTERVEQPPRIGSGRPAPLPAAIAFVLVVIGVSTFASDRLIEATTTTAIVAIVVLSLTVVTGYAGQVSLAQFALAGCGAWIASRLSVDHDVGFTLASFLGVMLTIPIGVLVGLPALRTRGVNLAVVTIGLALVLESLVLNNSARTGGLTGLQIGSPSVLGIDVDTTQHPERFAILALVCLAAVAVAVANLRRGRVGRRLVAVRTNERAAAALGISVFGAKLYAFGLSAGIAAVGGILLVFRRPTAVFYPAFSVFESILVVVYGVIGGIGYIVGGMIGGGLSPGGLVAAASGDALDRDQVVQLLLGVVVVGVLLWRPDGLASLGHRWRRTARPAEPSVDASERPATIPQRLEVRELTVRFGGVTAVEDVSFHVEPGEVLGLIGPNGAGKSTLLDAVTGFVRADGSVHLGPNDATRWSPRRRAVAGIGRSFQHLELFDTMTVRENLLAACDRRDAWAYVTDLLRPGRPVLGAAARAAVVEFDLADDLERRPPELSFGRRRLVALARAVAAEPSVLLLDEPAAGLGTGDTAELGRLLRRIAEEWNIAVVLVEHDVSLVLQTCDRVMVLDAGRVIAEGSPEAVRVDPLVVDAYLGRADHDRADDGPVDEDRAASVGTRADPVLAAVSLDAGYGDLAAVRDLDLEVAAGEIVALLGPNGAGKTTTLLTLAGDLRPIGGEVRVGGVPTRQALHRRAAAGTSLVPEDRAIIRSLTAAENLRLARVSVEEGVGLFPELERCLGRRVGLLSGGEQQMLAIAIALGRRPSVVLADELSLGLAPLVVDRLLRALRRAADDGVAVLVVEQHVRRVLDIADRVVVLRRGSVVLQGPAAELRADARPIEAAYLPT